METIGLLAGIGTLPVEFIEAVRPQGYRVVCIAVRRVAELIVRTGKK